MPQQSWRSRPHRYAGRRPGPDARARLGGPVRRTCHRAVRGGPAGHAARRSATSSLRGRIRRRRNAVPAAGNDPADGYGRDTERLPRRLPPRTRGATPGPRSVTCQAYETGDGGADRSPAGARPGFGRDASASGHVANAPAVRRTGGAEEPQDTGQRWTSRFTMSTVPSVDDAVGDRLSPAEAGVLDRLRISGTTTAPEAAQVLSRHMLELTDQASAVGSDLESRRRSRPSPEWRSFQSRCR